MGYDNNTSNLFDILSPTIEKNEFNKQKFTIIIFYDKSKYNVNSVISLTTTYT